MSLRDIVQAALDKNPLDLKTAVESELGQRVHDALQAKMSNAFTEQEEIEEKYKKMKEEDDEEDDDEDDEEDDDEDEDEDED